MILRVAEGLTRGHDDRVPGVNAKRVEVLCPIQQACINGVSRGKEGVTERKSLKR